MQSTHGLCCWLNFLIIALLPEDGSWRCDVLCKCALYLTSLPRFLQLCFVPTAPPFAVPLPLSAVLNLINFVNSCNFTLAIFCSGYSHRANQSITLYGWFIDPKELHKQLTVNNHHIILHIYTVYISSLQFSDELAKLLWVSSLFWRTTLVPALLTQNLWKAILNLVTCSPYTLVRTISD